MSGICGQFNLDSTPAAAADLQAMTAMLRQRGPDRAATWNHEHCGFGHTLLATTPELQFERQPFVHTETGCAITADVRLDNREELLAALGLSEHRDTTGDAELILRAYLEWSDSCVVRFLGDFAFAIWDPRQQMLFCVRDQFGMRPLYYHHVQGQHFLFASDARAILVLPQVPYRIDDGRVADFLVPELEWSDYTSTFYEGVFRLPPGHKAIVTPSSLTIAEYWHPTPGPDLAPMSDDDYRQGFLDVFTKAVDSRLRAPKGTVGAMLSGGLDSGSVVAVGKEILRARGDGPLATFSAARRRAGEIDCPESEAIYAASAMSSISPTLVHPDQIDHAYEALTSDFDEPFDGVFTMLHAIFLAAHEHGLRVVLDGGGGDMVLHEGSYIRRLIRRGQLPLAIAEIVAEHRYWGGSPAFGLLRYARSAMLPELIKKPVRASRYRRDYRGYVRASLISPEFAQSVRIEERIEGMRTLFPTSSPPDYAVEYCERIWPNMTAGRERYARIAAATGMEARDPFMDRRVIDFCSRMPGRFFLKDGWPKRVLRDVTADTLPKEVLWTGRKPHLGWLYSDAVTRLAMNRGELNLRLLKEQLASYVNTAALTGAWQEFQAGGDSARIHYAQILAVWLRRNATRPVVT